jgi:membrane associated rhomboid family serine protease
MNHAMDSVLPLLQRLFLEKPWALLAWAAVAMIVGTLVQAMLGKGSHALAILPRSVGGTVGIVTAPFVHMGPSHLLANLPPFLVMGALVVLRLGSDRFVETAAIVAVGSGVLVWCFARRASHMGASGVVFGLFGYLLGLAYLTRRSSDVLVALAVLVVYGGMLAGLRPARRGTSWESHLFGLLVGLAKVWWLRR